jgi:hypothetical protein
MMEFITDMVWQKIPIWGDDILVFDRTFEAYLDTLRQVFKRLVDKNVQLKWNKIDICSREITSCGRRIAGEELTFDPSMIEGLTNFAVPTNAGQLQKFLCGTNCIRPCIPDYAREVSLLQELLSSVQKYIGSLKKLKLGTIPL